MIIHQTDNNNNSSDKFSRRADHVDNINKPSANPRFRRSALINQQQNTQTETPQINYNSTPMNNAGPSQIMNNYNPGQATLPATNSVNIQTTSPIMNSVNYNQPPNSINYNQPTSQMVSSINNSQQPTMNSINYNQSPSQMVNSVNYNQPTSTRTPSTNGEVDKIVELEKRITELEKHSTNLPQQRVSRRRY
jgi:hypothetical protein